jgi:hypothetical protein
MSEFVGMTAFQDFVLLLTRDGTIYALSFDRFTGQITIERKIRIDHRP